MTYTRNALAVCAALIGLISAPSANAQQSGFFDDVVGTPTGEFVWDGFSGSYVGAHAPDTLTSGIGNAFLTVSPDPDVVAGFDGPGGIVSPPGQPGDLYAHDTTPTYDLSLSSLDTTESFTSVAVQFAITKSFIPPTTRVNLTSASFNLAGVGGPDQFEFLGARSQLPGNGGNPEDVDYFWAEWIGVNAASDLDFTIQGSAGQFQTLTAVKVSYFNTESAFDITAVPEPGTGVLALLLGIPFLTRRRIA